MAAESPSISSVLRALLRPVLRLCLRRSIPIQSLQAALKAELLELSAAAVRESGDKVTVSRLSVMTGINRREISRLIGAPVEEESQQGLISRVMGLWEQDKRYQTKTGKPRMLTWKGEGSEFRQLVEAVSKDANYKAVMSEMERVGFVERRGNKIRAKFIVGAMKTPEDMMRLLASDLDTLTTAVEENAFQRAKLRNLHMRTEYDNIFQADIPKLREWLLVRGAELHREAREYLALHDADLNPQREEEAGGRVVFTAFSWTEPSSPGVQDESVEEDED